MSRRHPLTCALVLAAAAAAACSRTPREPMLTYFNADHLLSLRYPAGWHSDQAEQDGMWYRYFQAPQEGNERNAPVSVVLLAGALSGSLDAYAEKYLAGAVPKSTREEQRPGATGKSWRYASADGATRSSLLLLQEGGRVYGLHSQGAAAGFDRHRATIDEMERSLVLERPTLYPEHRDAAFAFSLRTPASWRETRNLSGGASLLRQYASPPLLADLGRQMVQASLTLTVEPIPDPGDLDTLYTRTQRKLGDAFKVLSHTTWQGGYADLVRIESPVAVSRAKRYYRAADGRGYILALEAREDAFPLVQRWGDLIASTLKVGPETAPR